MKRLLLQQGKGVVVLFVLFAIVNAIWLHRMPGLLGDEASEGENVYEKLVLLSTVVGGEEAPESPHVFQTLWMGERSYIGPLIDYVRVPFIALLGYSTLALRLPMYALSLVTFLLGASVFRRLFGDQVAPIVLAFTFFSPIYLSFQRLGWAITLFPFFTMLLLWLILSENRHRALLGGFVAGLGLHNHILFLPTLVAVVAGWLSYELSLGKEKVKRLLSLWPGLLGFWAAFATQWAALKLFTDDQGNPAKVAELVSERWNDLESILPLVVSGSSYVARYTGVEFSSFTATAILYGLVLLIVAALALSQRRKVLALWLAALLLHLVVLMYMVDRFTLRYFLVFSLGIWVAAGVGLGEVIDQVLKRITQSAYTVAIALAVLLIAIWCWLVAVPFLTTGGSTNDFSLGNRTNSAAALVDVRPLITCLAPLGTISSENVHIFNRLQYLSHEHDDLELIHESEASDAQYLVHYRDEDSQQDTKSEACSELRHFIVERNEPAR